MNDQTGRDDRQKGENFGQWKTQAKRGSKAEKLSEPQVQSRLIFQVKGDLEAQWLGLLEQVMQSSESRFREWNNWWRPDIYLYSGCLQSEVDVSWTGCSLLLCPLSVLLEYMLRFLVSSKRNQVCEVWDCFMQGSKWKCVNEDDGKIGCKSALPIWTKILMQMHPVRYQNFYKWRASGAVLLERGFCSGCSYGWLYGCLWLTVLHLVVRTKHLMALCPCAAAKVLLQFTGSVFCFREDNNFSFFFLFSSYSCSHIRREMCCLPLWVSFLDDTSVSRSNAYKWKGSDLD